MQATHLFFEGRGSASKLAGKITSTVLLGAVLGLFLPGLCFATVWYVSTDGNNWEGDGTQDNPLRTIKAGLYRTHAGDVLELAPGTYTEYNIRLKSNITLRGATGDPADVIINAEGRGMVFQCRNVRNTTLEGLTMRGGSQGGMECRSSSITLRNCAFVDNAMSGNGGGGVSCFSTTAVFEDCSFTGNETNYFGGGIFADESDLTLEHGRFLNNSAENGGGLYVKRTPAVLTDCRFESNEADDGAGLYATRTADLTVERCVFFRNMASGIGGALYCYRAPAVVRNCTFSDNCGNFSGGIYLSGNSPATIENTISAFCSRGCGIHCQSSADVPTISCCDCYGNAGGDWTGQLAGQQGVNGNICEDPLFCDRPAGDLQLQGSSPCRNAPGCGLIGALDAGCQLLSVVAYADPDSGFAPLDVSFDAAVEGDAILYEWDFEGDEDFEYSSAISPQATHTYPDTGHYWAVIRVRDVYGQTARDSVRIAVKPGLFADFIANPTGGPWCLTVRFTPDCHSSGPSIMRYRWDFDGNGSWDAGTPRPDQQDYTYCQPGVYNATLEIEDDLHNTAQAVHPITVYNPPPIATVTLDPTNGPVPLNVTFRVEATSPNGPVVLVEIDPDDGTGVIELPGPGIVVHTYTEIGTYNAWVRVTDSEGESIVVQAPTLDVYAGPGGSPTAKVSASPTSGPSPLEVTFSPAASFDPDGTIVLYEWDFEYDGQTFTPDASHPDPVDVQHTYTASGVHYAALRVTDNDGLIGIEAVEITVGITVSLTIVNDLDTVNPYEGEETTIRTTQSAGAMVNVFIQDRAAIRVRTLFSGFRDGGTYDDPWDGTGDDGGIALDGDYYAFVEYFVNDVPFIEPDEPSGGSHDFITWSENYQYQSWSPWQNQFWEMWFNTLKPGHTTKASRVTLWITPYSWGGNITATLLQGVAFGSGTYRYWWDGLDDQENFAPNVRYLWSAQAWRLANNAIVVEGGRPEVTDPAANPNLFYPTTKKCLTGLGNEVSVTLSHDAVVSLSVYSMNTGRFLRRVSTDLLPAGTHIVEWDGKTASGRYAAPGAYRVDIIATTPSGNESLLRRVFIKMTY